MELEEYLENYNISLNDSQIKALRRVEGATLLLAVPGSGKTTVIVSRIGYMISCCGIAPESILTVTYTVSAARDMKYRFMERFSEELDDKLEFRTINGMCCLIIMYYERVTGKKAFSLIESEGECSKIVRNLYVELTGEYPSDIELKDIMTDITFCKNMMYTDEQIKEAEHSDEHFFEVFDAYRKYKISNKLMDYDDQLDYALRILKSNSRVLSHFQEKYRYINVDEAQDTSKLQHKIIELLASKYNNIFMVGDEDQSIYGFRAAYPQALLSFKNTYRDAEVLVMEQNYRSTKEIVEKANNFIKLNQTRYEKNMFTQNERGEPVKHTVLEDYYQQYKYILELAKNNTVQTAVLYRNNECVIPLIDLFERKGVSFSIREGNAYFFSHFVVTDILKIIEFSKDMRNSDLFLDIYYKMGFCMKKNVAIDAINHLDSFPNLSLIEIVLERGLYDESKYTTLLKLNMCLKKLFQNDSYRAINSIINDIGYGDFLKVRNQDFSKINILLAVAAANPKLEKFIERIAFLKEFIKKGNMNNDKRFIFSTIHSSKGLEYDRVVLMDVKDGVLPKLYNWETRSLSSQENEDLEEERRLFYVAVTRAKSFLEILSAKRDYMKPLSATPAFIRHFLSGTSNNNPKSNVIAEAKKITGRTDLNESVKMLNIDLYVGARVSHRVYGEGVITDKTEKFITVLCDNDLTEKKLDLKACIKNKLIKPIQ